MEHRFVPTMFAKECDILAEIHILEVIRDKTAVTTLYALAEFLDNVGVGSHLFNNASLGAFDKFGEQIDLAAICYFRADALYCLRCVEL